MRLKDKVAIVTGGANGIGRATVEIFLREGAFVAIADRDADSGKALADTHEHAFFVEADVSGDASVAALVEQVVAARGGLDILVNNAGIDITGSAVDTEPQRWQRVLDVNLSSIYRTCRQAIPHMIARGGGSIVNIASVQGMYGWKNYSAYATAKAGIFGFTRQAAVEYAEHNIRVNAISPGAIATQLGQNSDRLEPQYAHDPGATGPAQQPATEAVQPTAPLPRLLHAGHPEDIGHAALFLSSDEAAYISGHNLVVDGVLTARVG